MGHILFQDEYDNDKKIIDCGTYISAIGGDGTLLRAINLFRTMGKPFLGVAKGSINFLMNNTTEPNSESKYKKLELIKVNVLCQNGDSHTLQAFNDIMLGGDMNSWINFDVEDKDEIFGSFKGGGLIISTPQGSTGINKNNQGPILPISSNLWSITGDKTNRRIEYVIEPRKLSVRVDSRTPITLWVDGVNNVVQNVRHITVTKGDFVTVIFNNYEEFIKKRRI